jgi:hypothetical protein
MVITDPSMTGFGPECAIVKAISPLNIENFQELH